MRFTRHEVQDLARSWLLVSIAFTIVMIGAPWHPDFLVGLLAIAFTAGAGFILHELAHKFVAQKFGCYAEFKAFDSLLWLAVLMSFFGFVFAAPGAVFISGHNISRKRNGQISLAGPLTNFVLATIFLTLTFILPAQLLPLAVYGKTINAWLGLFNMIPFGPFDGAKVFSWSRPEFIGALAIGLILMIM